MTRFDWSLAVVVLAAAAAPTACGSTSSKFAVPAPDGGADGTTGASDASKTDGHKSGARDTGTIVLTPDTSTSKDSAAADVVGTAHGCDVSCQAAGGTCTNNSCTIVENPGSVSAGNQTSLQGGGKADSSFAWLYPYDKTVFPRALIPPTLQFAGSAPDAVMVHITYSSMDYTGYYGASNPARLKFPVNTWTALTYGATNADVLTVQVTKMSGGQVTGPITESWQVATGSMRGQVYYETYGSTLAGAVGIMSIAPGASKPTVLQKGCANVCHTASANGSTLVSDTGNLAAMKSVSYDLTTSPMSTMYKASNQRFAYAGLYPDGTFGMSATNYRTWMLTDSHLYDTRTGVQLTAGGWDGAYKLGGTTAFSPDGTAFAFNHNDLDHGEGHTLSYAQFQNAPDGGTKTFSNFADLTTDSAHVLAWPSFTPDSATIVYHAGQGVPQADGGMSSGYETDQGNSGDLFRIDVATKTPVRLDWLDGYGSGGKTYLPASDPDLNFAPTVLPEAVGGYFWVVFTSHRSYGNILPTQDNGDENGKLWVAAVDQKITPGQDSSHPAFYLDGQESTADNLRGFWVLPPCQQTGTSCGTGDECCSGFCRPDGEGGAYSCVPAPTGCANEYEKCTQTSDCCQAAQGYQCIGGFCAAPPPK